MKKILLEEKMVSKMGDGMNYDMDETFVLAGHDIAA